MAPAAGRPGAAGPRFGRLCLRPPWREFICREPGQQESVPENSWLFARAGPEQMLFFW